MLRSLHKKDSTTLEPYTTESLIAQASLLDVEVELASRVADLCAQQTIKKRALPFLLFFEYSIYQDNLPEQQKYQSKAKIEA